MTPYLCTDQLFSAYGRTYHHNAPRDDPTQLRRGPEYRIPYVELALLDAGTDTVESTGMECRYNRVQ